jgi:hypothetical protein
MPFETEKCRTDRTPETGTVLSRGQSSIDIRLNPLQLFVISEVDIMVHFSSAKNTVEGMLRLWGTSRKAIV